MAYYLLRTYPVRRARKNNFTTVMYGSEITGES